MRRNSPKLTIVDVNLTSRYAHLSDGRIVPIVKLFNHLGDETDSVTDARSFVASDTALWLHGQCSAFDIVPEVPREVPKPKAPTGWVGEALRRSQRPTA